MKKTLMFVLMLAVCLLVVPSAYADVEEVGQSNFETKVQAGGEIKLTEDVTLNHYIEIDKDVTIDLGTHTIERTGNSGGSIFSVKGGNVTIKNGTLKSEVTESTSAIIYVFGQEEKNDKKTNLTLASDLTIEGIGGVVVSDTNGKNYGTTVNIAATINSNHDQTNAVVTALAVHGTLTEGDVVINVTGSLTGLDAGIYQAGASTINLKGAIVTGKSGVVTKAGNLNVTGATILGNGELVEPAVPTGDGFTPTGAGIQVESNNSYVGNIDVNVNGGQVTSKNNSAIQEYAAVGTEETSVKEIKIGGNATIESAEGKEVITASEKFTESNKNFIAKGTVLKGKVENISEYLGEGLEISTNGKVIDPTETKKKPTETNPATGDNLLTYVSLSTIALIGTLGTGLYLKKVNK